MKSQLVDTHCHLYLAEFAPDLPDVIQRAVTEGIERFYMPSIASGETHNLLMIEEKYPGKCFAMMGLHPCSVNINYKEELGLVEEWLARRKFAGIGEIGLDYYWDKTFLKEQIEAFHLQIEWALHYDLPIIIHSRVSMKDCIKIIKEHQNGKLKGIFHCFTDNYGAAMEIINAGFYLGIGGVITYKNSGLAETLREIPLERVVLETDSPYLTPVPFRGKRNESSYLKYIVEKISEIKNLSKEEVCKITTANAQKIFES